MRQLHPRCTDHTGTLNGVQYCTSTLNGGAGNDGHRSTSQLFTDQPKSNLVVITGALAKRVNFDANKTAVSVTYAVAGLLPVTISAKREIIISAGAFQSPQLLMVSGIGPAAQLQKFGVPVVVDLPGVGAGMQDHIFFSPAYQIQNNIYNVRRRTWRLAD